MKDSDYDLVYILRRGDYNPDLQYSLRSVAKFCKFRNIWLAGFKPSWVQNARYIEMKQSNSKWTNSTDNLIEACKQKDLSQKFILMNDDFFALHDIPRWKTSLHKSRGSLFDHFQKLQRTQSVTAYEREFLNTYTFLSSKRKPTDEYELHIPLIVDKTEFLELMRRLEIIQYRSQHQIFMKRTIYKNYYTKNDPPRLVTHDVKLRAVDATPEDLKRDWLSVADDMTDNPQKYPILNKFLSTTFDTPCIYETAYNS